MGLLRRRDHDPSPELIRAVQDLLVRAPQAATVAPKTSILGMIGSAGLPNSKWADEEAFRQAYYAHIWVYRCVQVIAEDLSSIAFRVGADPDKPADYDTLHPLAVLLGPAPGTPNPTTSARRLWQWTVAQWLVQGRYGWEIEPSPKSGLPMFLWPLPASRLTPIASTGGDRYWDRFEFNTGQGSPRNISRDRIVYDWRPSGLDWRQAENALQAAKLDVQVATMQDRYDYAFLKNDARPAAVIVHEQFASVAERDVWREQFIGNHGGPEGAGKVHFAEAEGGLSPKDALVIQTLGLSQRDAEFIARNDGKLKAIEVAFGVPRSRLGDSSARTFSNAEEEWKGYYRTTIKNLALDLADSINTTLAPKFGLNVGWFDFIGNEWLRDDPPFPVEQAVAMQRAGLVTVNEVRAKVLFLPPVEGGDDLVAQPSFGDLLAANLGAGKAPAVAPADDATDDPQDPADAPEGDAPVAKGAPSPRFRSDDPGAVQADTEAGLARREAIFRQVDATVTDLETIWQRRLVRLFNRQMDAVLSRLNGKRGRQALRSDTPDPADLFDQVYWRAETDDLARGLYEDVMAASLAAYRIAVGISFDLHSPWADDFILQRANQLAGQVTQTTYDGIKAALVDGIASGESIPKLADRIRHLFTQTYSNRAETVARTEVISGYNGGTWLAVGQSPIDVAAGVEWIATGDLRTRPDHAAADGQIVGNGQAFSVGGESLRYPGDPEGAAGNTINCRCTIAAVAPEYMPAQEGSAGTAAALAKGEVPTEVRDTLDDDADAALRLVARRSPD